MISEIADKNTERYELPADVTVTVHEGKTVVAKIHNVLKPVTPDILKTGDDTNVRFWGYMAITSVVGATVSAVVAFRKKKED